MGKLFMRLAVRIFHHHGREQDELLHPGFDKGELGIAKERGLDDCSTQARRVWTAEGFKLVSALLAQLCRGVPSGYMRLGHV